MNTLPITIIGAGAAGLFCAGILAQHGINVRIIDNGKKLGRKILMSGGGKCNFTNLVIDAKNYLSQNPHFCKSALKRFNQWDFINLVEQQQIAYQEQKHGQLFCTNSAQDIVDLLVQRCDNDYVHWQLKTAVADIEQTENGLIIHTDQGPLTSQRVIIATGGLSMPALGMTTLGYKIAEKFSLPVIAVRASLVPFTLQKNLLDILSQLAGISVMVEVSCNQTTFKESLLFTHRGLSGPAILQISNYWQPGQVININLFPDLDIEAYLSHERVEHPNLTLKNSLSKQLPKRLVECLLELQLLPDITLKQLTAKQQTAIVQQLTDWQVIPNGTEGYRTAEVTLGGVSTDVLSSKTMAVKTIPNLYFIGEVVDVTGWLGGYNFQWAWSSAYACAMAIINDDK